MPTAATAEAPTDPCVTADALAAARDAQAAADYDELVERCAAEALAVVTKRQRDAGRTEDQRKADALKTVPGLVDAARRLRDAGFDDEAREKVQEIVVAGGEVPRDLRPADSQLGVWKAVLSTVGPPLRTLAEFLAVVALLVLLVREGWREVRARRHLQLRLEGKGVSEGLLAGLRENLSRLRARGGSRRVRFVGASEPGFEQIPSSISAVVPSASLIVAVIAMLAKLVPRREVVASVSLRPKDAASGYGITVSIARRRRRMDLRAIWEADIGGPPAVSVEGDEGGRHGRLLLAAAIWIGFREELGDVKPALGTDRWRSYALFSLGAMEQAAGRVESARQLYHQALDDDVRNLGALVNLGSLLLVPSGPGEPEFDAQRRLERAELLLKRAAAGAGNDIGIGLRVAYLRAVGALRRGLWTQTLGHLERLEPLVARAKRDPDLERLAADTGRAAEVLREIIGLHAGDPGEGVAFPAGDWYGVATHYARAAFWAQRHAIHPGHNAEDPERALDDLRTALARADPDLRRRVAHDPFFDAIKQLAAFEELVATGDSAEDDDGQLALVLSVGDATAVGWSGS